MKCNRCGNEFGEGLICQHCGIDRVEGLGSYKGLDPFTIKGGKLGPGSTTAGGISVSNTNSMLCFSCGEIIPGEAEYCPFCQKEQYVKCPNCGFRYLAQYPSCYKCGTNRESYLREKKAKEEEEQKRREAQAKEEAEKHRIQKEKEMRDAENRRLFEAQTSMKVVQSVMGHADIKTTMDIYAEATNEKKTESFKDLTTKYSLF